MPQMNPQHAIGLAIQHHMAGRLSPAEQLYRQILAVDPRHPDANHFLGLLAHQTGHSAAAVELIRDAIAFGLTTPDVYGNLGNALAGAGQFDDAIAAFRQSLALNPIAPTYINLGNALQAKGELEQAIDAYRNATAADPNLPEAHNSLGNAMTAQGKYDLATASCERAITLRPGFVDALVNLGNALRFSGQLDRAIVAYRRALTAVPRISIPNPDLATVQSNLAGALTDLGKLDEALVAYREAVRLAPDDPRHGDNVLLNLLYQPGCDAKSIAAENAQWNRRHALPLEKFIRPHQNIPEPDRQLRIGYISPDFRNHVVGRNILPLFRAHDRGKLHIVCYANSPNQDAITKEFQTLADDFVNIAHLSDEQAADKIKQDRIDILVDLALHTHGNRLLVLARKPAPVQATFAGYPASTGMTAIDYRLSDPYLDPPGADESLSSEKTIRLPNAFWCYDPAECRDIPPNVLPADKNSFVTFGCLNNFCKINDHVLQLWVRVLQEVGGSHLLLLTRSGIQHANSIEKFASAGIDPGRIEFVQNGPRRDYLGAYHRIDIALDTFPYNGHTTSLDSFWMGVPVVTRVGETPVARAGWCQLSNLGLPELAGSTDEEFVRIAAGLASDRPKLAHLRNTLRQRMEQSPLMNAEQFARNIEAVLASVWRTWCEQQAGPVNA